MSAKTKEQLFRTARLAFFVFAGALLPLVLHWHGAVTASMVEASVVSAGEVTFRFFVPSDAALAQYVAKEVAQTEAEGPTIKVPPAVF